MDAKIISAWVAFFGTLVVSGITIWQNFQIRKDNKKEERRKRVIDEKLNYEKKLNDFYIPLRHCLENSKTLFKIFIKDKPENFRTLTYLLDKDQLYGDAKVRFNNSDKALIESIIEIGKKIENLIYKKSYLIGNDDEFVNNYIPRADYSHIPYENNMTILSLLVSHIVVLRLAYKDELDEANVELYEGFVFPNEVNIRINEKIESLRTKISLCQAKIIVSTS